MGGPIDPRRWTVVCKHWLKNLCMKDDECDYLHQYDTSRMPVCPSSTKGKPCTTEGCVFKHNDPNEKALCPRYALGYCNKGPQCTLRHERQIRMPEYLPDWYFEEMINPEIVSKAWMKTDHILGESHQPPLQGETRYFVTIGTKRQIRDSRKYNIWTTAPINFNVLIEAMRQCEHVVLIFLCPEAHTFAGFAKVLEVPDPNLKKGILGEHPNFRISWKEEKDCDLELTNKLKNSYDGKAPVRTSKEFQEVEKNVAIQLCALISRQKDRPRKRRRRS